MRLEQNVFITLTNMPFSLISEAIITLTLACLMKCNGFEGVMHAQR